MPMAAMDSVIQHVAAEQGASAALAAALSMARTATLSYVFLSTGVSPLCVFRCPIERKFRLELLKLWRSRWRRR